MNNFFNNFKTRINFFNRPTIEATLILILGIKFFLLVLIGKVTYYVHPRLLLILSIGWFCILIFSFFGLLNPHQHNHERKYFTDYILRGLYSVFLLTLIFLPTRVLTSNPTISVTPDTISRNDNQFANDLPENTGAWNFADWYGYFNSGIPKPELYGKTVNLKGYIANIDLSSQKMEIARLVINCCTADGTSFNLPVNFNQATIDNLPLQSDEWYQISGQWGFSQNGVWEIIANNITKINSPTDPYIYP